MSDWTPIETLPTEADAGACGDSFAITGTEEGRRGGAWVARGLPRQYIIANAHIIKAWMPDPKPDPYVAPEPDPPREWWVVDHRDGTHESLHRTKEMAELACGESGPNATVLPVREVVESKAAHPGRVFASTTANSEHASTGNITVGVTAHCQCGNVFCDDVVAGAPDPPEPDEDPPATEKQERRRFWYDHVTNTWNEYHRADPHSSWMRTVEVLPGDIDPDVAKEMETWLRVHRDEIAMLDECGIAAMDVDHLLAKCEEGE